MAPLRSGNAGHSKCPDEDSISSGAAFMMTKKFWAWLLLAGLLGWILLQGYSLFIEYANQMGNLS